MKIGIIGAGHIGGVLTRRLTELGHEVTVANSRGPETLKGLTADTGAQAGTVTDAARDKDVVIVTIPEKSVPELPKGLFEHSRAVVVDTGNYYPQRDGRIGEIESGTTESRWVSEASSGWYWVTAVRSPSSRIMGGTPAVRWRSDAPRFTMISSRSRREMFLLMG